ncbi:MAG: hypothetical protein HC828_17985 [Blastochloris sp.]|nr:hypothetical protein [Blastochloris sp.]
MRQDICTTLYMFQPRRRFITAQVCGVLLALLVLIGFVLHQTPTTFAQSVTIYYVSTASGNDANSGQTWADAFQTVQQALLVANPTAPDRVQIWVAAGTYYSDQGGGQSANDRTATFSLKDNVAIYGGFAGTETSLAERNPAVNITILSGDLDQSGTISNHDAYRVITSTANDNTALLDGFTITGAYANGNFPHDSGAGIFTDTSMAQFVNLIVAGNFATAYGGGIANFNSTPIFSATQILSNTASTYGGGVYNSASAATFVDVTIRGNNADIAGGGGANFDSTPLFSATLILSNTAGTNGGGVHNSASTVTFADVTIQGNTTNSRGGGLYNTDSTSTLMKTTLISNTARFSGGGLANEHNSTAILATATIMGNESGFAGGRCR